MNRSRSGLVLYNQKPAGVVQRLGDGTYEFSYFPDYLARPDARAVSLTLPLQREAYRSTRLFPFFSGILAEGVLKTLQCQQLRIDPDDDFTRLLKTTGHDVIGPVNVKEQEERA